MTEAEMHLITIIRAWEEAGPRPDYHAQQQDHLYDRWPTLYWAIQDSIRWRNQYRMS